ncbi:multisubunit potassium/proton antiporter PhaG subunit [Litoreibacter ponti]|uniref:Multisubunit potassium/proton antiporter PhaG subunit n=1 Tax=Litoreibacter ponti TaxID=1510457 RepID=A0A2T6BHF3_9RHOB|nr:monovalent cation/H(+) antiporter subunit G [Litoreibacter ponti]PTX55503.1 multisubunit potassium/proton antiporter PhaG subunit [Litoreibacter ponti]
MTEILEIAAAICLVIGSIFTLVGAIGLLKFNDSMTRMHAPTKVGTVGVGMFLLASIFYSFTYSEGSLHQVLIMAFLFVTAPISANFLAKVNIHKRSCDTPPTPPRDDTWSTLNVPVADRDIEPPKSP